MHEISPNLTSSFFFFSRFSCQSWFRIFIFIPFLVYPFCGLFVASSLESSFFADRCVCRVLFGFSRLLLLFSSLVRFLTALVRSSQTSFFVSFKLKCRCFSFVSWEEWKLKVNASSERRFCKTTEKRDASTNTFREGHSRGGQSVVRRLAMSLKLDVRRVFPPPGIGDWASIEGCCKFRSGELPPLLLRTQNKRSSSPKVG